MDVRIPLEPDQIVEIWHLIEAEQGKSSLGRVARYLADHGVLSQATRRPFSRQAIFLCMLKSPEGASIMDKKRKARHS